MSCRRTRSIWLPRWASEFALRFYLFSPSSLRVPRRSAQRLSGSGLSVLLDGLLNTRAGLG